MKDLSILILENVNGSIVKVANFPIEIMWNKRYNRKPPTNEIIQKVKVLETNWNKIINVLLKDLSFLDKSLAKKENLIPRVLWMFENENEFSARLYIGNDKVNCYALKYAA